MAESVEFQQADRDALCDYHEIRWTHVRLVEILLIDGSVIHTSSYASRNKPHCLDAYHTFSEPVSLTFRFNVFLGKREYFLFNSFAIVVEQIM